MNPTCGKCGGKNITEATNAKGIENVYLCHDCAVLCTTEQYRQKSIDKGLLTAAGENAD